jgi:hypothetical protein
MLQNRLAITAGAIAFALLILGNFLVVRYEVKGSEERITRAIVTENDKLRAWELSQSQKPRSYTEHSHCFMSGTGQWPEEATTSDCSDDVRPNGSP